MSGMLAEAGFLLYARPGREDLTLVTSSNCPLAELCPALSSFSHFPTLRPCGLQLSQESSVHGILQE